MKREEAAEKVSFYLQNAIAFAAMVTGTEWLGYLEMGIDLVYQNLEWSGLFVPDQDIRIQRGLKNASKKALRQVADQLSEGQRQLIANALPRMQAELRREGETDFRRLNDLLKESLQKAAKEDAQWRTPKELRDLTEAFLRVFFQEARKEEELSIHILWKEAESLEGRMGRLDQRVARLESAQRKERNLRLITTAPSRTDVKTFLHRGAEAEELCKLFGRMDVRKAVLINGLGGIGKTALARNIFYRLKDRYAHVGWINYENSLAESLLGQVNLFLEERDQKLRYRMILRELQAWGKGLLLFIDNMDHTEAQDPSIDFFGGLDADVIITSRMPELEGFLRFSVGFMKQEECADIFYCYYKYDGERKQRATVEKLVNLVQCHTLSVELLAKSANVQKYRDLGRYLQDLKDKGFGYPNLRYGTDHTKAEYTMAKHLGILFNMVNLDEAKRKILRNFSVMPDMTVPLEAEAWLNCDPNDLQYLVQSGWLQEQQGESGYRMPDVAKRAVRLQERASWEDCVEVISFMGSGNYFEIGETFRVYEQKLRLAEAYAQWFSQITAEEMGDLLTAMDRAYQEQGNCGKALESAKKAYKIRCEVSGKNHPSTGICCNNIGSIYYEQGAYEKALKSFRAALYIFRRTKGERSELEGIAYNNMGGVYLAREKYEKALEYFEKALEIRMELHGEEHPYIGISHINIGTVYQNLGEYGKALEHFNGSLQILKKVYGENHPSTGKAYNNLGSLYYEQQEYEKALENYKKALKIRLEIYGENHPSTGTIYNNIGAVYKMQGNHEKALENFHKALKINREAYGEKHPTVVNNLQHIGELKE